MDNGIAHKKVRTAHLEEMFQFKQMEAIEQRNPSRKELPHRHDYFVIIFVETASGSHHIDFKKYPLTPNTLYFVSPEQVHYMDLEASPKGKVLLFTVDFLQQFSISPEVLFDMEVFFNCDEAPPVPVPSEQIARIQLLFDQMQQEYEEKAMNWLPAIGASLKMLLLFTQRIKASFSTNNKKLNSRKSEIIRQFKKDLERQYKKLHKVNDYASLQNLSSIYLNEVIKGETGISAKDYIQNRIVLEAKRLAQYSDFSMKEIAFQIGFEDPAHFSKVFKKCQGVTFSAFKAQSA